MEKEQLKERRERRAAFLWGLYQAVDGDVNEFVHGFEIAAEIGADEREAKRIIAYFEEKGFIRVDDHKAGVVRITAEGVDVVENSAN